jgi:hypothetical protein
VPCGRKQRQLDQAQDVVLPPHAFRLRWWPKSPTLRRRAQNSAEMSRLNIGGDGGEILQYRHSDVIWYSNIDQFSFVSLAVPTIVGVADDRHCDRQVTTNKSEIGILADA